MKKIICALLLLLAVNSWSDCTTGENSGAVCSGLFTGDFGMSGSASYLPQGLYKFKAECSWTPYSTEYKGIRECAEYQGTRGGRYLAGVEYNCECVQNGNCTIRATITSCSTQCEADSVANYASCIAQGYRWENCRCVEEAASVDSLLYVCNDSPTPDGTSYQYKLYAINMHFESGTATTACGVPASLVGGDGYKQHCPVVRSGSGTCQSNGLGNVPPQECSDPSCKDVPLPNANCYAVVGSKCYMKDIYSGNTFSCECDGSCQQAIVNLVSGNCRNPYPPPSSSGSGGDPSSSGSGSDPSSSGSGSDPSSSGSGSDPSSSGSDSGGKDYTDQLNQIIANTQGIMNNTGDISQWTQTTMNNTIDIKNEVSNIGIDVGNIRQNTGSIDGKLSTTNRLLGELNNKEWSVEVNVAGDTNIINVSGDTAKAPKEILELLQNSMTGEQNSDDTAGSGGTFDRLWGAVEALVGDTTEYKKVGDSVGHAVNGLYEKGFGAIRDTLGNSAIADSMGAWSEKLTDNGVISGSGSDQCPSVLTQTWDVRFPFGKSNISVTIGPLGKYLCYEVVSGMGITFWSLCRVIIRAMVAISCMIWLYKSVLGIDGGSNEED